MIQNPAVLHTVREAVNNASGVMPGHRFSLYFPLWITETGRNDIWEKAPDIRDEESAKLKALRPVVDDSHKNAVDDLIDELLARQQVLAELAGAQTIKAESCSPFVTGMGEEHAVENGFAFLNPYGLPYLAGSGVKGVIRRVAEELAQAGEGGWTFARVAWLFGYENNAFVSDLEKEREAGDDEAEKLFELLNTKAATSFDKLSDSDKHLAGALSFWDVIIDGELDVDILTPHYTDYYQGKEPPHDSGKPQPNPFLVVAPGATFTFHVTCTERRLPESLRGDTWRNLIKAAFDHAFEWGGFGAKTAVGYGVLETEEMRARRQQQQAAQKPLEVGDKVEIGEGGPEKYIGRKGEIIKILPSPVVGENVAQLRAIDDQGKIKGMFPLSCLKRIIET